MRKSVFSFDLSSFLCAVAAFFLARSYGASTPQIILWAFLAENLGRWGKR